VCVRGVASTDASATRVGDYSASATRVGDYSASSTRVGDYSAMRISLGSAGFDWRKVGSLKEIDSQCNICACQGEGFRCGGGTHFVCMLCVEQKMAMP
jgi:hypothetical protein